MPDLRTGVDQLTAPMHEVIRASAGSGKTFALTSRYLRLHANGISLGCILATTFTRAAAGEIRDRILIRLTDAVNDDAERLELAEAIEKPGLTRDESIKLVRSLVGQLHRLQIRTLDSFFAGVVHTFGLELGISPAAGIANEEQTQRLRFDALALVLERHKTRMVPLLRRLTRGDAGRSIVDTLDRTVKELHDRCRTAPEAAWDILGEPPAPLDPAALESVLARLERIDHPKQGETVRKDVRRFREDGPEALLRLGIAKNLAEGGTEFSRRPIDPEIVDAYGPLLQHVTAVLTRQIRDRTEAIRELLKLYDDALRSVKRTQRLMSFSDVTLAMVEAVRREQMDEILFRLDAKIRHLLLDEFQDTSVDQFQALRPLALEILAGGSEPRSFFCVGDQKQSIYGWRDACPEILASIDTLLASPGGPAPISTSTIQLSYRSSPLIIDTVNRVFDGLPDNPAVAGHIGAAEAFAETFATHDSVHADRSGVVQLLSSPKSDGDESKEDARLATAAGLLGRLHRDGPGHSIGVLVSTNRAVAKILALLGPTGEGISVGVRGGGPLTDATPVNAVLDLLRLVDHAEDTVAAFHVARGPLGRLVGLTDETDRLGRIRVASVVADDLLRRGYAAVLADIVSRLAPSCDAREYARLHEMLQLAGGFDAEPTLRADDFVRLVEGQPVQTHERAPVEVMTVHQAKGLEFDLVVLPDLDRRLGEESPSMAWQRVQDVGEIDAVCPWVAKTIRHLIPSLKPVHAATQLRYTREMLCKLYVSMTRARFGLFMIIDPPGAKPAATSAGIVHHALAPKVSDENRILFESGDLAEVFAAAPRRAASSPPETRPRIVLGGAPTDHRRSTERLSASRLGHATHRLETDLVITDHEWRDRGTAIHALFASVEWLEGFEDAAEGLRSLVREATPRRPASWHDARIAQFRDMLARPEVRRQLSLDGRDAETIEVWRERPYARISPEGSVDRGTFDRVEIVLDDATPVAAVIIDYKTESIEGTDALEAAERHRRQLDNYRGAVAELAGVDLANVRARVLFVEGDVSVELDSTATTGIGRS